MGAAFEEWFVGSLPISPFIIYSAAGKIEQLRRSDCNCPSLACYRRYVLKVSWNFCGNFLHQYVHFNIRRNAMESRVVFVVPF